MAMVKVSVRLLPFGTYVVEQPAGNVPLQVEPEAVPQETTRPEYPSAGTTPVEPQTVSGPPVVSFD